MRNLIGYLRKTVLLFSLAFLIQLNTTNVSAQIGISTYTNFNHTIKSNGYIDSSVSFFIVSSDTTVLTYYTLTLAQNNIEPQIYSVTENKKLEATVYNRSNSTDILIDFENAIVSPNRPYEVSISYSYQYLDGNVIDLLSKVQDSVTENVTVKYPKEFGESSWISDQPEEIKSNTDSYILNISKPDSTSIKIIFDQGIVYGFNISKSLNNNSDYSSQYELLLPPDTQFQKLIIDNIEPKPSQSIMDNNGNYLLIYTLEPNSNTDVKISGYLQMEYHDFYFAPDTPIYNTKDIYWSLEGKNIREFERYLELNNYNIDEISDKKLIESIYYYVIEKLTPSTDSSTLSGGFRKGCIEVLDNALSATGENYADVIHTFLTYYEIPSIYTLGYVSDISNYQEDGMFHYWVQVYNGENWIVLDPFLEDYSKVSLYGREQLDHITILNRKFNPISPTLTYFSDNDISFEYITDQSITYLPSSNVSISLEPYSLLNRYLHGRINIENTGNTVITSTRFTDGNTDLGQYIDNISFLSNQVLLPHSSNDINFYIPYSDIPDDMIISTVNLKNGYTTVDSQIISTEYSVSTNSGYEVVIKIISALLFLLFLVPVYLIIDKVVYKNG